MKTKNFTMLVAATACALGVVAQDPVTGTAADNELAARTPTFFVNALDEDFNGQNNDNTESLGVSIAGNGNVIIGWEDDGDDLADFGAVWTLYNSAGTPITPVTTITSLLGGSIDSSFLSYFRSDDSPTPGNTAWGPKIKANLFGDGIGMGATAYGLSAEVPELADYDEGNTGDIPTVQLVSNSGEPVGIRVGVPVDYALREGDIRVGDWDYLADGNVVIVGESRQDQDLVDVYGGDSAGHHVVFSILDPEGNVVKDVTLVSETPTSNSMWHGVGVTENGFAVRFEGAGGATVRMFDNSGTPTTGDLDIGTLTEHPETAGGGRGDGAGFHGNGVDAYVIANASGAAVWVTVLETDGTVRYSKAVSDDVTWLSIDGSVDAAINDDGRVFAVWAGAPEEAFWQVQLIMGRVLDSEGDPIGGTFYVSEAEFDEEIGDEIVVDPSRNPRVAARDDFFAVVWQSKIDENTWPAEAVTGRFFGVLFEPGSIESVGLSRIVPDTPVINQDQDALGNWEPYASVLGTSTFLIEGNAFAEDEVGVSVDFQRYVVALQPANGDPGQQGEAFYGDDNTPFTGQINLSRQNGNPGRVAGDKRPDAVNFMTGGEASPHDTLMPFQSDGRWDLGYDRWPDGRYGTVQIFALDPATLVQTPVSRALDAVNGRLTEPGPVAGGQMGRFGGDLAALDNGNFVAVVEDRSQVLDPSNTATAVIMAPDGSIVTESFVVAVGDIWSNVAAYQGGFAVRVNGIIHFFDNEGNLQGQVDQSTSNRTFDTGRGDGTRIAAHINSPYVFLVGSSAQVVSIAVFDSRDQSFVVASDVSEPGFAATTDRAGVTSDALNRVVAVWESTPAEYELPQTVARVLAFDDTDDLITPLTSSFFPFVNVAKTGGIRTIRMSVAMTTREICIAAKGEINLENEPENGATSPAELNFYTVFTHPAPADDPTIPVGGLPGGPIVHLAFDGDYCSGDACLTGGSPAGAGDLPPLVDESPTGQPGDQSASFDGTVAGGIGFSEDTAGLLNFDNQDYTLEAWVKIGEGGAAGAENPKGMILGYGIPGGYSMWIGADGTLGGTTYGIVDLFTDAVVPATGWHHVAQVHQIGVEVRFYVDGVLAQTLAETRGVAPTTDNHLYIGYERGSGDPLNPFNGLIDRIRITGSALTPDELDLSGMPLGTALVGYWPLDGDLTEPVGGHHGIGHGDQPLAYADGQFGQGVDLDSALNQYVEAGGPESDFDMTGGSVTLSAWFRVDAFDTDWQCLIAKGEGTNYRLARRGGTDKIAYAGGVGEPDEAAPSVNDGEIHHVVAVTRADVQTELWIDGVLYEVGSNPSIADDWDTHLPLLIGANPDTDPLRYWNGLIDDVGVWARALSEDDIAVLWNNGDGAAIGDIIEVVIPPEMSITLNEDGTVTVEWTGNGVLEVAPTVNGSWEEVDGATSPYTFEPTEAMLFGRIKQ